MDMSFISNIVNGVAIAFGIVLAVVGLFRKSPFEDSGVMSVFLVVIAALLLWTPTQDIRDNLLLFFLLVGLGGWAAGAGFRGIGLAAKRSGAALHQGS